MKFRYKVLFINILLTSLAIGISCLFMIDKNFDLALDAQIKSAVDENNILQATVEYQLLGFPDTNINSIIKYLRTVCNDVVLEVTANQSDFCVIYNGNNIYTKQYSHFIFPEDLWKNAEIGRKSYIIMQEESDYFIYTTSCSLVAGRHLNVITKHNITEVYRLTQTQISYYRIVLIIVTVTCSVIMFLFSYLLTKPLEALNQVSGAFGKGDYTLRATITSNDEIGMLAQTYNQMADSVSEHVNELEDMIKRQDQFVSDFSHELKTPMTSIIGYADMLRRKEMSRDNQVIAASYIFDEGKRLELMSHKLFDLIYAKQKTITKTPFDSMKLMQEVASSVTPALDAKELTLQISCDNQKLLGDTDLLKSAFINLIDNARKASSTGAHIVFSGRKIADNYQFIVKDFGIGIEPEHLSHIIDEFYMVDKSRSRKEGGAGLGLSLAVLIFKCHDATMQIESMPKVGTTITITFGEVNTNA